MRYCQDPAAIETISAVGRGTKAVYLLSARPERCGAQAPPLPLPLHSSGYETADGGRTFMQPGIFKQASHGKSICQKSEIRTATCTAASELPPQVKKWSSRPSPVRLRTFSQIEASAISDSSFRLGSGLSGAAQYVATVFVNCIGIQRTLAPSLMAGRPLQLPAGSFWQRARVQ